MKWKVTKRGQVDAEVAEKVKAVLAHLRDVAEDPDQTEGVLRDYLRQTAKMIETLNVARAEQSKVIGKLARQFGILACLFGALLVAQLAVALQWV